MSFIAEFLFSLFGGGEMGEEGIICLFLLAKLNILFIIRSFMFALC